MKEQEEETIQVKLEPGGESLHLLRENGSLLASGSSLKSSGAANYPPERVLTDGIELIKSFAKELTNLDMGNERRKETWTKEVDGLTKTKLPETVIAVCGATGAGKSTLLNAVLGDNILLTSGMQACTAVVTEISYLSGKGKDAKDHRKRKDVEADICFLTREEWKAELAVLLEFMHEEDGTVSQSDDRDNARNISWLKVHAVYPTLTKGQLVGMTPDEIIGSDRKTQRLLGTTKNIQAENSRAFETQVTKYIDSNRDTTAPSLWPLIRLMKIKCCSKILRCGATLVDLPGVEDANVARGAIAKEYLKNCNRIWIAAPIKRAVDNKVARDLLGVGFRNQLLSDGNYDSSHVAFIATHTDDVSCREIIRSLDLEKDPKLYRIKAELSKVDQELKDWKSKEKTAIKFAKVAIKKRDEVQKSLERSKRLLWAFGKEDEFEIPEVSLIMGQKRKSLESGDTSPTKRMRQDSEARSWAPGASDNDRDPSPFSSLPDDDQVDEDPAEVTFSSDDMDDVETDELQSEVAFSASNMDGAEIYKRPSQVEEDTTVDNGLSGPSTVALLKADIAAKEAEHAALEAQLKTAQYNEAAAKREKALLERTREKIQMQQNRFCSLKRSEFSKRTLKEDFRAGLKDLDSDGAEERRDGGCNVPIRDYSTIDLPVFPCSSRDYLRLSNLSKGDGTPQCFTTKADTGIPALQTWCYESTIATRLGAVRTFLQQLHALATSIRAYVDEMDGFSLDDRLELRSKWHDDLDDENDEGNPSQRGEAMEVDVTIPPSKASRRSLWCSVREVMAQLVRDKVDSVKEQIDIELKSKGTLGADNAATGALTNCDTFAAPPMRWNTYRAVIQNRGEWKMRNMNDNLVNPLLRELSPTWGKLFGSNPFASVADDAHSAIADLIKIPDKISVTSRLRCQKQVAITLRHAKTTIDNTMNKVERKITNSQKDISRNLTPYVRAKLEPGYRLALEEKGKGSFSRQKEAIRTHVDSIRRTVFNEGLDEQLEDIDQAVVTAGNILQKGLYEVANKVEVNMSVLWEPPKGSASQLKLRRNLLRVADGVLNQVKIWTDATKHIKSDKQDASMSAYQYTQDTVSSSPVKGQM